MTKPLEIGEKVKIIADTDVEDDLLPLVGYYIGQICEDYWISSDPERTLDDIDVVIPERQGSYFTLNFSKRVYLQSDSGQRSVVRFEKNLKGLAKFLRKVEEQYV